MDLYLGMIISAIISYLLGGINGAIILSKIFYHQDIREYGSKNPGFTNFKRVYGNSFIAWSVIIIDVVKTALPVFMTAMFFKEMLAHKLEKSQKSLCNSKKMFNFVPIFACELLSKSMHDETLFYISLMMAQHLK